MVRFRPIFYLVGWLILILALAMIPSAAVDFLDGIPEYKKYLISQTSMVFLGGLLVFSSRSNREIDFDKRDSFVFTSVAWIVAILISSLPFMLSQHSISPINSLFESVSGLTTTGATVLRGLDHMSRGILLWRSMLQWLGGIGIVVMALTILTDMRVGGLELFQSESSDRSEKFLPRITQIAKIIFLTYVTLTVLCFGSLFFLGMTWFDALCHSLSTISTGGFSTHDASIGFFQNPMMEMVLSLFMWAGGVTQLLFGYFFTRNWRSFFRDEQVRAYFKLTLLFVGSMMMWNMVHLKGNLLDMLPVCCFNVISALTTTGFSSADYSQWTGFGWMLFFVAPFLGGCTGSTSGGIKIFRFQVLWKITSIYLKRLRRPHAVFLAKYNGRQVSESVFDSVASFVMLFLFTYVIVCFLLTILGLDFLTSLSAGSAMLTNLGPGLGPEIGPIGTYADFGPLIKGLLMVAMLLGRLELVTLLILFMPNFWKD